MPQLHQAPFSTLLRPWQVCLAGPRAGRLWFFLLCHALVVVHAAGLSPEVVLFPAHIHGRNVPRPGRHDRLSSRQLYLPAAYVPFASPAFSVSSASQFLPAPAVADPRLPRHRMRSTHASPSGQGRSWGWPAPQPWACARHVGREREQAFVVFLGQPHIPAGAGDATRPTKGEGDRRLKSNEGSDEKLNQFPAPLQELLRSLRRLPAKDCRARMERLLSLGNGLRQLSPHLRTRDNLVLGCQSVVHVHSDARKDETGTLRMYYMGHAEALTTKGLLQLLVRGLSGATPKEIDRVPLNIMALAGLSHFITPSRMNGFTNILTKMKAQAAAAARAVEAPTEQGPQQDGGKNFTP
uniref:Fe-S metabolism associated domain-containing protein, putative n=2 Tax=Neospora caninum (strain Liverpool) TaxID=572307 RepID=A0A0F7USZ1_NEOCL|nr:TPA: Fe-S metabolism associated domain-containing protein, putative [Neospora caninum Liverpool]